MLNPLGMLFVIVISVHLNDKIGLTIFQTIEFVISMLHFFTVIPTLIG